MTDLNSLIKSRSVIKRNTTRFKTFLNKYAQTPVEDRDYEQLVIRNDSFQSSFQAFEEIQTKIEQLENDENTEREEFEDIYYTTAAKAMRLVAAHANLTPPASALLHAQESKSNVATQIKLPTIAIPEFDGTYEKWPAFYSLYNSLIHNNNAIDKLQKFHFLKTALKKQAAQVIESLEISEDNYDVALDLIKERYENKRIIIQTHIKALFNLPTVTKESHKDLRLLLDATQGHVRALQTLGQPCDKWDTLLIHLITTKIDKQTIAEWERTLFIEMPTFQQFITFLNSRCRVLEHIQCHSAESTYDATKKNAQIPQRRQSASGAKLFNNNSSYNRTGVYSAQMNDTTEPHSAQTFQCPFCKQAHAIYKCSGFIKLSINDRYKQAQQMKLCINCLRKGHTVQTCRLSKCKLCHQSHNTLLHGTTKQETNNQITDVAPIEKTDVSINCSNSALSNNVLLSTAIIKIDNGNGIIQEARVLLDSGSQANFITEELCDKLQLSKQQVQLPITGINNTTSYIHNKSTATIKSKFTAYETKASFFIVPKVTANLPTFHINHQQFKLPQNIKIADPTFHVPGKIDALIGAQIFWDVIQPNTIQLRNSSPHLHKTQLGWILAGNIPQRFILQPSSNNCFISMHTSLKNTIERFWKIEESEFGQTKKLSKGEQQCEEHFQQNTKREADGRYTIKLPVSRDRSCLGESKNTAMKRLEQLEQRFTNSPTFKESYSKVINEFISLNHMEECTNTLEDQGYFIPHHAVFKDSSTTQLRVVFDASAKTTSGISLNDILLTGPQLLEDLISLLLKFRQHKYVLTGDIEKMYRQVNVNEEDRELLRILWRPSIDQNIKVYQMTRLPYGLASSSFIATRCLQQLASDEEHKYPVASRVIKEDFYVDDMITGSNKIEDTKLMQKQVSSALLAGGFRIRKWCSNNPNILAAIPNSEKEFEVINLDKQSTVKTLGLGWKPVTDTLQYTINTSFKSNATKRDLLSNISKIFDPLGLISPVIVTAKILIQRCWKEGLAWDELLPTDIKQAWELVVNELPAINQVNVPRHVINIAEPTIIEIHGFSDASEIAYGACLYIRSINRQEEVSVQLLCAKTRVAPVKQQSIPRLELCAALLLSTLLTSVQQALKKTYTSHFYTDSTVVLSWLQKEPSHWQTFVANRVSKIQQLTNVNSWHHVRTADNPADCLSRGISPNQIGKHQLWWEGPKYLHQVDYTPLPFHANSCEELPDSKKSIISLLTLHDDSFPLIQKYSSFNKLLRITAYCLRFINNAQRKAKLQSYLTVPELRKAEIALVRICQKETFSKEFITLIKGQLIPKQSKLRSLDVFISKDHLIRVGGRLHSASILEDQKHQIILPAKHHLTELIIQSAHYHNLHSGAHATLAFLRLRYWPIDGKSTVKRVLSKCLRCYKTNPKPMVQPMGSLPKDRVNPSRPFSVTGVDYAGPIQLKPHKRSKISMKGYIALFICFSTKAIHLEAVTDLTSEAFIAALRRFISRRGCPQHIHSDNGTNFVGAQRQIASLLQGKEFNDNVQNETLRNQIQWHFIPPRTPNFGGLWEANIKSVKQHLRRVLQNTKLIYEELATVLTQIEACINSRPLTPLSSSPNDLSPLTPAHFLSGGPLTALPDDDLTEISINRLSRWEHLQQLQQHFWRRWSHEYLNELQQRVKWQRGPAQQLHVGDLVLLKDELQPPFTWPLGRITHLYPGSDNIVRVVQVKTLKGSFKRGVCKLCPLPVT